MLNHLWIYLLIFLSVGSTNTQPTAAQLLLASEADAFATVSRCPSADPNLNPRPVIGILSQPGDSAHGRLNNATNASYIAASYVKFVESAGARVVPLIYNEPWEVIYKKLNLVNGVIFTGGRPWGGLQSEVTESIFEDVLRRNDAGDHFPLLAICLGFELLLEIVSEDDMILEKFNAESQASTLEFMKDIDINGTVFQRFPPDLLEKLSAKCLAMQYHRSGISPEKFQKNDKLCSFFKILTTSLDKNDKTAVQWHPEKNAFEWHSPSIPHSEDAVRVTQHVANFIVREARMSMNRPSADEVLDNLINNYSPTYCAKAQETYDEVYIFS